MKTLRDFTSLSLVCRSLGVCLIPQQPKPSDSELLLKVTLKFMPHSQSFVCCQPFIFIARPPTSLQISFSFFFFIPPKCRPCAREIRWQKKSLTSLPPSPHHILISHWLLLLATAVAFCQTASNLLLLFLIFLNVFFVIVDYMELINSNLPPTMMLCFFCSLGDCNLLCFMIICLFCVIIFEFSLFSFLFFHLLAN